MTIQLGEGGKFTPNIFVKKISIFPNIAPLKAVDMKRESRT